MVEPISESMPPPLDCCGAGTKNKEGARAGTDDDAQRRGAAAQRLLPNPPLPRRERYIKKKTRELVARENKIESDR